MGFLAKRTDNLILARRPENNNQQPQQKKKRICEIVDFAVPAHHRITLKACEKKSPSTLRGNWKKLWSMNVAMTPIGIGAFWYCLLKDHLRDRSIKQLEDEWRPTQNYDIIENCQNNL